MSRPASPESTSFDAPEATRLYPSTPSSVLDILPSESMLFLESASRSIGDGAPCTLPPAYDIQHQPTHERDSSPTPPVDPGSSNALVDDVTRPPMDEPSAMATHGSSAPAGIDGGATDAPSPPKSTRTDSIAESMSSDDDGSASPSTLPAGVRHSSEPLSLRVDTAAVVAVGVSSHAPTREAALSPSSEQVTAPPSPALSSPHASQPPRTPLPPWVPLSDEGFPYYGPYFASPPYEPYSPPQLPSQWRTPSLSPCLSPLAVQYQLSPVSTGTSTYFSPSTTGATPPTKETCADRSPDGSYWQPLPPLGHRPISPLTLDPDACSVPYVSGLLPVSHPYPLSSTFSTSGPYPLSPALTPPFVPTMPPSLVPLAVLPILPSASTRAYSPLSFLLQLPPRPDPAPYSPLSFSPTSTLSPSPHLPSTSPQSPLYVMPRYSDNAHLLWADDHAPPSPGPVLPYFTPTARSARNSISRSSSSERVLTPHRLPKSHVVRLLESIAAERDEESARSRYWDEDERKPGQRRERHQGRDSSNEHWKSDSSEEHKRSSSRGRSHRSERRAQNDARHATVRGRGYARGMRAWSPSAPASTARDRRKETPARYDDDRRRRRSASPDMRSRRSTHSPPAGHLAPEQLEGDARTVLSQPLSAIPTEPDQAMAMDIDQPELSGEKSAPVGGFEQAELVLKSAHTPEDILMICFKQLSDMSNLAVLGPREAIDTEIQQQLPEVARNAQKQSGQDARHLPAKHMERESEEARFVPMLQEGLTRLAEQLWPN